MARFIVTYQKVETAHTYIDAASQAHAEELAENNMPEEFDISWSNEVGATIEVTDVRPTDSAKDAEEEAFYDTQGIECDNISKEEKEIEQYLSKKDQELITEYSQDFSTDKAYGQLSVVQILRETVADLVSRIPEIERLSEKRRNAIEEQIMLFNLSIFDQGKQEANEQAKIDADYRKIAQSE